MKDIDILRCGNLWQSLGDQQAGRELTRCLRSSDPQVRGAAQEYLAEAGPGRSRCCKLRWHRAFWKARRPPNAWSRCSLVCRATTAPISPHWLSSHTIAEGTEFKWYQPAQIRAGGAFQRVVPVLVAGPKLVKTG
jgi:hypothetical protein